MSKWTEHKEKTLQILLEAHKDCEGGCELFKKVRKEMKRLGIEVEDMPEDMQRSHLKLLQGAQIDYMIKQLLRDREKALPTTCTECDGLGKLEERPSEWILCQTCRGIGRRE